ncbi:MAG: AAA family ATPase [Phycisphaerales bacterium]
MQNHPESETRKQGMASRPPHSLSRTVAFMNQKGGVGKTTTVVNLAHAVCEAGRSVLVIDLDPQAHATLHLGADPDAVEWSVYDLLLDPPKEGAADLILRVRDSDQGGRLGLVPAVTDQAAIEHELADSDDRMARLASFIAGVREHYEFIFLDCPPSLGLLTLNGLAACKEVIVPMQAHFLALQGVGKLLETVRLVGQGVNDQLRVSGVVLCMHDEQTRHAREVVDDLKAFFASSRDQDVPWRGARVYDPPVRRNIKLAEAPSFGQTIFEYAKWCPGAQDYRAVAKAFVEEWDALLARRARTVEPKPVSVESVA